MLLFIVLFSLSHKYAELMANLIFSELYKAPTLSQLEKELSGACVAFLFVLSYIYIFIWLDVNTNLVI